MRFLITKVTYHSNYDIGKGLVFGGQTIDVAIDVYTEDSERCQLNTWVELPYSKKLTLEEMENKAIEMAKEKLKMILGQI
ncbi:hypothetical protein [Xenorhabdus griffiniae]|uniref:Uncharacterized protein n=1 Tax=Xenorhabdus griffiniae TaxID=351672 RepID=A0ABY9XMF3_9GAMM|nr:hypothetical protein [Xenorhabdus griffiniae]MBD1228308.1 hypothetical protein [Xenorhabdus griffiniae]MBE8587745.1 hypothetical protein [Xenorhabdus griffiniae]WMV74055.1 hypothetical protein QL128_08695 [Xenorhabdus griffiniae]WNH03735.1 hypothetical protein QL112_008700 [Xenorhabdus griffiniae]